MNQSQSCRILQNFAESCRILQNLEESYRIRKQHNQTEKSEQKEQKYVRQYHPNQVCQIERRKIASVA